MKKVIALMMTLLLCLSLVACGDPTSKFGKLITEGKYADAIEIYTKEIQGDASREVKAEDFLYEYLGNAWEDYLDETASKEELDSALRTLEKVESKLNIIGGELDRILEDLPYVEESKENYQSGLAQLESGDYEAAMESFSEVDPIDGKNYEDAAVQYEKAEQLYVADIVKECEERISDGNYTDALDLVERARYTVTKDYPEFEIVIGKASTGIFESGIHQYADNGDYAAMLELYDEAAGDETVTISAEITKFVTGTVSQYRQDVIGRSVEAYKAGGYNAAIPVISEGLLQLGADPLLLKYEELYQSCIPVKMSDVTVLKASERHLDDQFTNRSVKDAYGNQYEGPYADLRNFSTGSRFFDLFLDGKYQTFDVTYFARAEMPDYFSVRFCIYADDVEIYSSGSIYRLTEANSIKLDVTNVRTLRLEAYSTDCAGLWESDPGVEVVNGVFTRAPLTDAELNTQQ